MVYREATLASEIAAFNAVAGYAASGSVSSLSR